MSTQIKIIIAVVIAIAVVGGGYLFFFSGSDSTTAVGPDDSQNASAAEQTFVDLSTKAQSISFDTSIFSDPRFTSLVDTRTTIVTVPTGRPDPFAAIAGEGSSDSSAGTTQ
jgi:hypothetical protein